jgi:hypothetical protein
MERVTMTPEEAKRRLSAGMVPRKTIGRRMAEWLLGFTGMVVCLGLLWVGHAMASYWPWLGWLF